MFTVTEDLVVPAARAAAHERRVAMAAGLLAMFRPGGGRGAIYVLAQMALFLAAVWLLRPTWVSLRWFLAVCGYICFFTGVPAAAFRFMRPARAASFQLRVAVLVLLSIGHGAAGHPLLRAVAAGCLRPRVTPAAICSIPSGRWRTGPSWKRITGSRYRSSLGLTGLLAYLALIHLGMRMTVQPDPIDPLGSAAAAGEPGSANIIY